MAAWGNAFQSSAVSKGMYIIATKIHLSDSSMPIYVMCVAMTKTMNFLEALLVIKVLIVLETAAPISLMCSIVVIVVSPTHKHVEFYQLILSFCM